MNAMSWYKRLSEPHSFQMPSQNVSRITCHYWAIDVCTLSDIDSSLLQISCVQLKLILTSRSMYNEQYSRTRPLNHSTLHTANIPFHAMSPSCNTNNWPIQENHTAFALAIVRTALFLKIEIRFLDHLSPSGLLYVIESGHVEMEKLCIFDVKNFGWNWDTRTEGHDLLCFNRMFLLMSGWWKWKAK